MNSNRTLSSEDLPLQDTGALAAAEYGRLAVWAHALLFSGLGSLPPQLDGAPVLVLHLDHWILFVLDFSFCHAYLPFVLHPRFSRKELSLLFPLFFPSFGRARRLNILMQPTSSILINSTSWFKHKTPNFVSHECRMQKQLVTYLVSC